MNREDEDPVGRGQNAVLRPVGKLRVDELRKERHEEHDEHRVRHLQRNALHEEGKAPDLALDGRAARDGPMLRAAQGALETHRAHAPVLDAEPDHVGRPHHAQKRIGVGRGAQNEAHARRRNGRHDDGARRRAADRPDRSPEPVADRLHERHQDARSRRRHGHDGSDHEKGIEGKVEHGLGRASGVVRMLKSNGSGGSARRTEKSVGLAQERNGPRESEKRGRRK